MSNSKGFTLIEVVISIFILSIGIMAAASMQINSIKGNHGASYRSNATHLALSFLEELKRLPFNDTNLTNLNSTNLDDGKTEAWAGQPLPGTVDHKFIPANFPVFASNYQLSGPNLIDNAGHRFLIFWNIDNSTALIGSSGDPAYCTIRLFVFWDGPMGKKHLEFTTIKYNDQKV
jgi:type IV pilus assembly protein PilV